MADHGQNLSDLNPEILKLPQYLQDEFNKRFEKEGTADYLILRAEDCIKIIENEKAEAIKRETKKTKNRKSQRLAKIQLWVDLYQQEFNVDIRKDIENLYIPKRQKGFNWLIIVHKSFTAMRIFNKLMEKFYCVIESKNMYNLEGVKTVVERPDTRIYAIWAKDRVEADIEHKFKSAVQIKKEDINSITLEERLLLELWYYRKNSRLGSERVLKQSSRPTKNHLDLDKETLCAGSRVFNDTVPFVRWDDSDKMVRVGCCRVYSSMNSLCCRQVVS